MIPAMFCNDGPSCLTLFFQEKLSTDANLKETRTRLQPMVGGMVQNSTNENHYQHQQPIYTSSFFFYINNKIRPTSTINTIINIRNMLNSTTKENQHQQQFCLTTNIVHRLQQQKTRSTIWARTTFYGRGRLGPRNSNHRTCWEIETRGNKHGG